MTYNRDNSMIAFDNGASSMQQISYYDHLSRDDEDTQGGIMQYNE
jgi:hypothetical protein